ncbi:NAD-dependent epimerase/dehydratase family protein [Chloroflexota bacterium]
MTIGGRRNMILVTGAAGHIGNVLVRQLLKEGQEVQAMIMPGEDIRSLKGVDVEMVEANVLDFKRLNKAFKGIQTIFHLAGMITILPGEDQVVRKVNIEGTRNVIKAAKENGVNKLIYTSSIHAVKRIRHGVIDESAGYDPETPYGEYDQSKARATLEVEKAARDGLEAVITCPTGVIGPYDFRGSMMGSFIRSAAIRKPTLYVDGAYDFVDVRDVADGLIQAARKGKKGESYILSGHQVSIRFLLEMIREATGKNFFQMKIPFFLARIAALMTPLYYKAAQVTPKFTPYSLDVIRSNSFISHLKASRELGYQPRSLYESISDTARWFIETADDYLAQSTIRRIEKQLSNERKSK